MTTQVPDAMVNLVSGKTGVSKVLLATATASNSSAIQFTSIPSGYGEYEIYLNNVISATANTNLLMQFSENNGSSWLSANYAWQVVYGEASTAGSGGSSSASAIQIFGGIYNGASAGGSGVLTIPNLGSAGNYKYVHGTGALQTNGAGLQAQTQVASYQGDTNAINALQLYMASGNITSGTFALYGIRNS